MSPLFHSTLTASICSCSPKKPLVLLANFWILVLCACAQVPPSDAMVRCDSKFKWGLLRLVKKEFLPKYNRHSWWGGIWNSQETWNHAPPGWWGGGEWTGLYHIRRIQDPHVVSKEVNNALYCPRFRD